jgi:hypothetical protein
MSHTPVARAFAVLVALCLVVLAGATQAAVIDAFDSGAAFDVENVGAGASLSQPADVLGGERSLVVSTRAVFDPALGLELVRTGIASNARIDLTYTADHVDITSGANRFEVTTERAGSLCMSCANSLTILVIEFDDSGSRAFPILNGSPVGVHDLPFPSDLGPMTKVILELTFEGDVGNSIRLTDFRTVDEPRAAGLLVAALALLATSHGARRGGVARVATRCALWRDGAGRLDVHALGRALKSPR